MGAESLALGAGIHKVEANGLLNSHKMTYRVFLNYPQHMTPNRILLHFMVDP